MACLLLLTPLAVCAGTYGTPTYSGGAQTSSSGQTVNYSWDGAWYVSNSISCAATAQGQPQTCSSTSTGQITITIPWIASYPGETPPKSAVVKISPLVLISGATNGGGTVTGTWNDGLGGSGHSGTMPPPPASVTASVDHYQIVQTDGSGNVKVAGFTPSISVTGNSASNGSASASIWVDYLASASPITLGLGGVTMDSSHQANILVGQYCKPGLLIPSSSAALIMSSPTCTVSGDTYTSFGWSGDQSSGGATPYPAPPVTPPAPPVFYWKDSATGSEIVQVSATLYSTGPNGGYIGTVSAKGTVRVWGPEYWDAGPSSPNPQLGTVGVNPDPTKLGLGGTVTSGAVVPGNQIGFQMDVAVGTPTAFTSSGTAFGGWAWLQLVRIDESQGSNGLEMASPELDSSFPYLTGPGANGVPGTPNSANSSPGKPLYCGFADTPTIPYYADQVSVVFTDDFNLYVMYQPPDSGTGVNWVPLYEYNWNFNAAMGRNGIFGSWTPSPPGSDNYTTHQQNPAYPSWTSKYAP